MRRSLLIAFAALILSSTSPHAQTGAEVVPAQPAPQGPETLMSEARARFDLRYDRIESDPRRQRLQGAIRLGVVIDVRDLVDVRVDASTGTRYTSRWSTLHDFEGGSPGELPMFVRRLYLQRRWGNVRAQLGAIPPIKGVASSTGIEADGWIDGGRLEWSTGRTIFELVVGGLHDLNTPNVFTREQHINYAELEITHSVSEGLIAEISTEHFSEDTFVRGELRWSGDRWLGGGFKAGVEGLTALERPTGIGGVTLGLSPLAWADRGWDRWLSLRVWYAHIDRDMGRRGQLADDFIQVGNALSVFADGDITETLGWFGRAVVSDSPRYTAGLSLRLKR